MTLTIASDHLIRIEMQIPHGIDEAFVNRGVAKALAYAQANPTKVFGEDYDAIVQLTEVSLALFYFMPAELMPATSSSRDAHTHTGHTHCTICNRLQELAERALKTAPVAYLGSETPSMSIANSTSCTFDKKSQSGCDHACSTFSGLMHSSDITGTLPELWVRACPKGAEVLS